MVSQFLGINARNLRIFESFDQDVSILHDGQERHDDLCCRDPGQIEVLVP